MSVQEMNFADYDLREITKEPRDVYALAGGLLPEMASAFDYETTLRPSPDELSGLVGEVGKNKELQENITAVQAKLGTDLGALELAIDWSERSGSLESMSRAFVSADTVFPKKFDAIAVTGGVARWMLRRRNLITLQTGMYSDARGATPIYLMTGNRPMGEKEHDGVSELAKRLGRPPTESEFADYFIKQHLEFIGFDVNHKAVDSGDGATIFAEGISANPKILDGSVMVVGNAPSAVMTAGQFYNEAWMHDDGFNSNGDQLFVSGDSFPLARTDEQAANPAEFQNPYTALGQIARNGLLLHKTGGILLADY